MQPLVYMLKKKRFTNLFREGLMTKAMGLGVGLGMTIGFSACQPEPKEETAFPEIQVSYPTTKKEDVTETLHGTVVNDPYRWLEDDNSEATMAWVKEQNAVTNSYLEKIPFREGVREYLTDIANYEKFGQPFRAGKYFFFQKNDGLQNQSVLYRQEGLTGTPEVFLDPNKLSEDGTTSALPMGVSPDFKYMCFSVSKAGSDWKEIWIADVETKAFLKDTLKWVKFSGATWLNDGFFYCRYDAPEKGKELSAQNQFHKVYYHKLGTAQASDPLIHKDKDNPLLYHGFDQTEDKRFQILYVSKGTSGTELRWRKSSTGNEPFAPLYKSDELSFQVVDNVGDQFICFTNQDAPQGKIVLVDPANPAKENWKTVVAEKEKELLTGVSTVGGKLILNYLKDVTSRVYQFSYDGKMEREIELPALGSAGGFSGYKEDEFCFYTFTSYNYPPTIFKYEIASGKSELFKKVNTKQKPEDFEVKQVFYPSKDGTPVSLFLIYKKGLKMDGKRPVYLYGYGGFNISLSPSFSGFRLYWAENDGVIAIANLRGGGEYGEPWHSAGKLLNKQNVFDDFIAAAEYLIKENYTNPQRIAIAGGSNGGLLVGAAMTQRPDLFKVALPAVGVLDMLRYHKFTVGWGWMVEYGSPDSAQYFPYLYKYSPLHNLKAGTNYPATLIQTADHDDRVVPAHSFKFAAALQEAHKGKNPQLIRIETQAGHGGSSLTKAIDLQTDVYAFTFYQMGISPKVKGK